MTRDIRKLFELEEGNYKQVRVVSFSGNNHIKY